jgi:hypothetical protein
MAYRVVLLMALLSALASLVALASKPRAPQSTVTPPAQLLRVDSSFFQMSAGSGGDFYFWSPGEFARSRIEIPFGGEDLLLFHGELNGSRCFEFPVDTLLSRLEVFVGAQELELADLARPDGSTPEDGDGARIQAFEHMRIVTLEHPACGTWRLDVRARGLACVTVRGGPLLGSLPPPTPLEPILLVDVDFVEHRGRPGHEGWFPIEHEPRAGEELLVRVDLAGSFAQAELGFVRGDDTPLVPAFVPLERGPWGDVHARCVVPSEPFRVVVRGLDDVGAPFRRVDGPLFSPASPASGDPHPSRGSTAR